MSKSFTASPKPKRLDLEKVEAFENSGSGHDRVPASPQTRNAENPKMRESNSEEMRHSGNAGTLEPEPPQIREPLTKLCVELPQSAHRRFKAACVASGKIMTAELIEFVERRTRELENPTSR